MIDESDKFFLPDPSPYPAMLALRSGDVELATVLYDEHIKNEKTFMKTATDLLHAVESWKKRHEASHG